MLRRDFLSAVSAFVLAFFLPKKKTLKLRRGMRYTSGEITYDFDGCPYMIVVDKAYASGKFIHLKNTWRYCLLVRK
jgi:hypothetical protein